ncbi:MAG: MFS transporter [Desulfovibrionales bacterium]
MRDDQVSADKSLLSFELISLYAVALLAFCNIAVFYSFHPYMEKIGIPAQWRGLLLSMEPLAALVLRPMISPRLHLRNGVRVMAVSLVLIIMALVGYRFATTVPSLVMVRLVHGTGFVALVSGAAAVFVHFVPQGRSAAAFGFFTIMTQAPFAIMPPVMELLLRYCRNEAVAYAWVSLIMLPAIFLLYPLQRRIRKVPVETPPAVPSGFSRIREALQSPDVRRLLLVNLMFFMAVTTIYFFLKDFALAIHMDRPGLFFTVYICSMLAVRALGTSFFDKLDKRKSIAHSLLVLAGCLALLGQTEAEWAVLGLAVVYGGCLGAAMPLINSAMFLASQPQSRGLNTNLLLSTIDAGYVAGPLFGGALLATGLSLSSLFLAAAGFAFLACVLMVRTRLTGSAEPQSTLSIPAVSAENK